VTAILAEANVPAYSASWTEEQMTGVRLEWVEMGALTKVGSETRQRWWKEPTTLVALGRDKKEASERTSRTKDHVGGTENLAPIAMGRHIPQQTVEFGHSVSGGAGLGAGEVAGGGENPPVDTPAIVQQIAYGDLEFFALGRCSEGGQVGRGTLGGGGAILRRCIEGRGGGWFNAKGAETLEERVDESGVGDGESALCGVVMDGGAKELVGDRVAVP
jgi:hypothetical protein